MRPNPDPLAPRTVLPTPHPLPSDRLCAAMWLARMAAVSDQPDEVLRETAARCVMELRHTITKAAHAAFFEKQAELDHELREAAQAFLADLRAAGGPDGPPPPEIDAAAERRFVALLDRLSAAAAAQVEVKP